MLGFVYNPTNEVVKVKCLGAYLSFPAKKLKSVDFLISDFIDVQKKYTGLVALGLEFSKKVEEDFQYINSQEAKDLIEEKSKEGISNLVHYHQQIVDNALISLQKDLDQANIKAKVTSFMSKGELDSLKKLEDLEKITNSSQGDIEKQVEKLLNKKGISVPDRKQA